VSNKKHKHALAASGKRAIRFDLTLVCNQGTFPSAVALSPQTVTTPPCLPSPTLSSFLTIYKAGIPHSPTSVSLPTDSANISLSYTIFLPVCLNIIPWISIRRLRKQILFFLPIVLLRSHSTVLGHYGELPATRFDSQLIHSLPAFVDFTRIVPVAVIASLVVHQQRPSSCRSLP
jgi:hypothetical protein